jgi:RimJ/RimL family protein N-acetyltransferase
MTEAVKVVTDFGWEKFGLERITAPVFDFNEASARVLEKVGYILEGLLRKHYQKDGKIFDSKLYAIIKDDL